VQRIDQQPLLRTATAVGFLAGQQQLRIPPALLMSLQQLSCAV
jgi:hypothetical protein